MTVFYKFWNINPHRAWVREFLAEFLGTFMLIFLGNSAVAENVLTNGGSGAGLVYAGYALGAYLGVLVSAGVSGAHLNPAVTVAGAFVKKVDWVKVPHYLLGQYLGSFVAACCTFLLYIDSFNSYHHLHGVNITTAGIFATYPKADLTVLGGFIDQILGTMILLIGIYAIIDKKNTNVPLQLVPFYVALLILSIGCSIGINEGFAINPARDFAPRLFTYFYWGPQVFSNSSYWYIPIVGPHIGAILGAVIYVQCIEKPRDTLEDGEPNDCSIQIIEKKIYNAADPNGIANEGKVKPLNSEIYSCRL